MARVVDLPLEGGGMLLVQPAAADEPSGGFGLASSAEEKVKKDRETLESALAHTVCGSPAAGSMATGSSQADARRWASRHRPGPGVPTSPSQTGTFA